MANPDRRVTLSIPELLDELGRLGDEPEARDPDFPFVLSAGERRSHTANTIYRDPTWRKSDADGALRVHPDDAQRLGITDGGRARLTTKRGSVETVVEVTDTLQPGYVTLPNGLGTSYPDEDGGDERIYGVRAERADRLRGPRLARGHAAPQARRRTRGSGLTVRRAGLLILCYWTRCWLRLRTQAHSSARRSSSRICPRSRRPPVASRPS